MDKRNCHVLGILLMLAVASESGVIVPREAPSGDGELPLATNKFDKKLGLSPWHPEEGGDEFGVYDDGIKVNDPHAPPDYDDYSNHGEGDADRNEPGIGKPEIIPPHEDRDEKPIENHGGKELEHNIPKNTGKEDDIDKEPGDEDYEPFDGEEDIDKFVGDDEDSKIPVEEDGGKPNHKHEDDEKKEPEEEEDDDDEKEPEEDDDDKKDPEDDDDEKKEPEDDDDEKEVPEEDDEKKVPEEEDDDGEKKVPKEEEEDNDDDDDDDDKDSEEDNDKKEDDDEEKPDEKDMPKKGEEDSDEDKSVPEDDDEDKSVPEDDDEQPDEEDKGDENDVGGEESEIFKGGQGSIFDTPFFNVDKVKKYFHELERALGHVFRETVDEAVLLNGTYANTTEEEVDINGKKYVVQKSIIQGRDNHSTIYVETLSSIPKTNNTEDIEVIEMKNITET